MTAPARVGEPSPRDGSHKTAEKTTDAARARRRSAAAERAYARRAQRTQNLRGNNSMQQRPAGQTPKAPFVVMVMVVLGVGLAGIMYLSTQAAADSYRLQDARAEAEKLTLRVEQLRQDVALLESPTELAKRAAELGLVLPPDPARLRQNADGSIDVFGKAVPVPKPAPPAPSSSSTPPPAQPPAQDQAQQGQQQQQDQQQQGQQQPTPPAQDQQPPAQQQQQPPAQQQGAPPPMQGQQTPVQDGAGQQEVQQQDQPLVQLLGTRPPGDR